jgi:hypothetical protein
MSTMSRTQRIVRAAAVAAYIVAGAGAVAAVTIGLFFWVGQPWGTVNDLALLVMTLALLPLMLAFYELGGWTPTPLARAAQAVGWIAVLTWSGLQLMMVAGTVTFDYDAPASGAYAAWAVSLFVIGSWVGGANLFAGPWLSWVRWPGVVAGTGTMLLGIGLLIDGLNHPLTYVGGIGYQFVLPIWAILMARELGRHSRYQLATASTPMDPG